MQHQLIVTSKTAKIVLAKTNHKVDQVNFTFTSSYGKTINTGPKDPRAWDPWTREPEDCRDPKIGDSRT